MGNLRQVAFSLESQFTNMRHNDDYGDENVNEETLGMVCGHSSSSVSRAGAVGTPQRLKSCGLLFQCCS